MIASGPRRFYRERTVRQAPRNARFVPDDALLPAFPIVFAGFLVFFGTACGLAFHGVWPHKVPHVLVNVLAAWLLALLYLAWLVLLGRQHVPATSGAGFGVAGTALSMRAAAELLLAFAWPWPAHETTDPGLASFLPVVRHGGLVAFAVGLTFVVATSVAEWRRRPLTPDPATTPGRSPTRPTKGDRRTAG